MSLRFKRTKKDFFTPSKSDAELSEAYDPGSDMPEFAILSDAGVQIGPWMFCKDYIQDVWWGHKKKTDYSCHGFKYDPDKDPAPSQKNLLLAMRWKGKVDEMPQMLHNIKMTVEATEKQIGIPTHLRTRFSRPMGDMFIVYGSKKYLNAVRLVSFFTWMLRASFNNKGGKLSTLGTTSPVKKDVHYKKSGSTFIKSLFKSGIDSVKDDWDKTDVYSCHNQGFVYASRTMAKGEPKDDEYYDEEEFDF